MHEGHGVLARRGDARLGVLTTLFPPCHDFLVSLWLPEVIGTTADLDGHCAILWVWDMTKWVQHALNAREEKPNQRP
jgi:hypothetical protein